MQASLDASALKPFTKALICLSKYGDELSIYATPDTLSLSATNSSKSAYCRFKYERQFFSKYKVGAETWGDDVEDVGNLTGQILVKPLLSVLKHRTVDKMVERVELSIVEGNTVPDDGSEDEEHDSLESKLIVRLHCKHGVVKTHRLLLSTPTSLMAPSIPALDNESCLTIGPRAIRDIIEHFPLAKGAKSDPQLVWTFGESEVEVKSLESSLNTKGKAQLSTELNISADEFDVYNLYAAPITIAFHLREFNATIAFAESMSVAMDLRFTDPSAPLFIDVEGDSCSSLFVTSTSQAPGATPQPSQVLVNHRKREREDTPAEGLRFKKPAKVVQPAAVVPRTPRSQSASGSMMPPSQRSATSQSHALEPPPAPDPSPSRKKQEPLFLPSSQVSNPDAGLDVELSMDSEELQAMAGGEDEDVSFASASQLQFTETRLDGADVDMDEAESFRLHSESYMAPTQDRKSDAKAFEPLFED